jgi:hypothetical protein
MRGKRKILAQTQVSVGSHTLEVTMYEVDGLTVIQNEWSPTKPSIAELRGMNCSYQKSLLEAVWGARGAA